jgi:cell wall-associated NlpC family hydrolase
MTADLFVIRSAIAPLVAEPRVSSEQVSQRLYGHRVRRLESRAPWMRVCGEDGYEGWLHEGYARPAADAEAAPRTGRRVSLGCLTRRAAAPPLALPLGALLDDDMVVESGLALDPASRLRRYPALPQAVAESAATLFVGTPYLWGGITPWGADCSGFVQSLFLLHGVHLPRDAYQQADGGRPLEDAPDSLAPADLAFFSEREDGRITHVGIALGSARMAHIALGRGGFSVESWDSGDEYAIGLRDRYRGAVRILGD